MRTSIAELQSLLDDVNEIGKQLELEGAGTWTIGNPFGPVGIKFYEVRDEDSYSVQTNTVFGQIAFNSRKEMWIWLSATYRALAAAAAKCPSLP